MSLFDTHCHLDDKRFAEDFGGVLQRARDAGVTRIATIGCCNSLENVPRALDVARAHADWVVASSGVHPHDAKSWSPELRDAIVAIAGDPLLVAIGETGLDYHYDNSPRREQAEAFRDQIALARQVKKPLIVHTRSAPEDTLAILREEQARDVGGIIHCFSETPEFARAALELGFVSSFSGIVTFKNAVEVREAARLQPLDALLVETDAPYLAPIPHRGRRNEPAYVAHTADCIAALRGIDPAEVRERSFANALRVFGMTA
ncbi:MAG: TatD family hydrolase [Myxococcales bacterium]|nr:TatD family hydrolase [Myxococcales bacterium]MCB9626142.1 TatD family hydrolase [Sandaracinaceae bacterium]